LQKGDDDDDDEEEEEGGGMATIGTWCWMFFSCSSAYAFSTNTAVLMSSAVVSVAPLRNWNLVHSIIAAGGNGRPGRHAAGSSSVRLAPNHTVVPTIQAPHSPSSSSSSSSSFRLSLNPLLSSSFQAPSSFLSSFKLIRDFFFLDCRRTSFSGTGTCCSPSNSCCVVSFVCFFQISETTLMSA